MSRFRRGMWHDRQPAVGKGKSQGVMRAGWSLGTPKPSLLASRRSLSARGYEQASLLRFRARTDQRIAAAHERLFRLLGADETHVAVDSLAILEALRSLIEAELKIGDLRLFSGE
jgi:hypothetical protein